MTRLVFDQLRISNFKCFTETQTFNLRAGAGLHFIGGVNEVEPRLGSNGSGKSSIFDALCWCCYGRTPEGLRNPDIIPRNGKGQTSVTLFGDGFSIERTANPNSLLLNEDTAAQEQLDELLGMNFDTATHTIILGQSRPLFFDLEPRMKMELFSSVLNLDRWEQRSEKASTSAKDQQRELDIMSGTAAGIEVQIFQLKEMIEKLKSRSDEWTRDREDKLRDAAAQYEAAKAEFEKVENERGQADLSYDSAMTELRALNRGLQQLNEYLALARKDQVKHLAQVKADQVQVKRMQDHLDNIQEGNCPTCGQEIAAIALEKHCKEIQAEIAKLKKTQVPKSVVSQIVDLEAQIADASQQQSQFQDKADKAKDRLDFYQREASRLETILRVAQSAKAEYEVEANPYREQLEQLKRKNSALGVQKKDIDQKMIVKARQIERAKLWIKGFKDIRLNIIEEVTQELELATNAMLDEVGLPDWQVKYVIEQETKSGTIKRGLDVIVLSPYNRRSVRWETWSGGEGQRLRLIGALALSEVLLNHAGVDPSLEILDEPTRHLSSEGVRDLCDFLSARAQQLDRAIFYCDHQSVQSTRFSSVTTVTKKAFGSLIEQQS